jgi:GNAT superfamily N-acetyltransferase
MRVATAPSLPAARLPTGAELRDGTAIQLRLAVPGDHDELARFFHRLSLDSLNRRFFGPAEPSARLLDTFCTSAHPADAATVIATSPVNGAVRAIAVASYFRIDAACAEVAFAVDDQYQGHGLGGVLLAQLAMLARQQGFSRLEAQTLPDNAAMLHVFRDCGLELHVTPERGCVTVHLELPRA